LTSVFTVSSFSGKTRLVGNFTRQREGKQVGFNSLSGHLAQQALSLPCAFAAPRLVTYGGADLSL